MTPQEKAAAQRKLANAMAGVPDDHVWPSDLVSSEAVQQAMAQRKAQRAAEREQRAAEAQAEYKRREDEARWRSEGKRVYVGGPDTGVVKLVKPGDRDWEKYRDLPEYDPQGRRLSSLPGGR